MTRLLVATRNPGKVREIREILSGHPEFEVIGLADLRIEETPEEDALEVFETFEENALAKARYFAQKTGVLTLADDSGICVDALGGAPGVRSRRFAGEEDARGLRQDEANNAHLLRRLADVPPERRTAHYIAAVALADARGREEVFVGRCDGVVIGTPRGTGGFGYDPLFLLPSEGKTMAELAPEWKNQVSHRGRGVRAAIAALLARWPKASAASG
ncbi:MAG TPA: RdgB/HAM1 family non-canonical purine NTP pyrophosphatase [Longimicrobium sp.]|nr:RdgB/HAM1 family non-canonical purine NTP pyrophosphatase [Longimicrobium sp.]